MKGVVFTEFLEMVEDSFGDEVADNILDAADLPSGGAYTAVGTYDHAEMVSLVIELSKEVNMEVPALLNAYGKHLFGQFVNGYGHFFSGIDSTFAFLKNIHNHIHVEVRKLYPEAELPHITCTEVGSNQLELAYRSERPFADFAEGLISGAIDHFGEQITVVRDDIDGTGGKANFILTRH